MNMQFNFIDHLQPPLGRHEMKFGVDIDTIHVISQRPPAGAIHVRKPDANI